MAPGMQVLAARLNQIHMGIMTDFTTSICGVFAIALGVRYDFTHTFSDSPVSLLGIDKTER